MDFEEEVADYKSYDDVLLDKRSAEDELDIDSCDDYARGYKAFMDKAKIEREVVAYTIDMAKKNKYKESDFDTKWVEGDKVYLCNKNKCLALVKVGKNKLEDGVKIIVAHMDSPRLDLKPYPLYQKDGTAYLKTHYYGGIKKYQWLTIPLAMHGVVMRADGKAIHLNIGEREEDPIFYISDLLPHLSHGQDEKKIKEVFDPEKLNIICGSYAHPDVDDAIKYNVMSMLNDRYGITEADLVSAEIEFVPALKARDVGFDRSYIAAYGHDDKVCAYSALTALMDSGNKETCILYLVDKEEVGSDSVSGATSAFLMDVLEKLSSDFGKSFASVRQKSKCISADVTSAYDSNYPEVFDKNNAARLSYGVCVNKYGGARGKSGCNDATAEYTYYIRNLLDSSHTPWQSGELGKVDIGGGGTVAKFLAAHNIDTIDMGVPVMSMHAPYELIAKVDLYSAYLAYKAFFGKK